MSLRFTCTSVILVALFALSLLAAPQARANGILLSGSGASEPTDSRGPVRLQEHRVRAKVTDQLAEVTVEQVFFNHSGSRLEGTYLFPLPEGAVVSQFAMTMFGKMVEGEVVEAKQARRVYESIVRRKRDPGLLEYVGRGLFRARVFPIEPHKPLTIRLTFQQVLEDDAGTLELRYPLATDRMNGMPVQDVSLELEIAGSVDIKAIYSPSHRVTVERKGERSAWVKYASRGQRQARDFLLYVGRSPEAVGFSLISQRGAGEDGTFMAVLAPPQQAARRSPKDVVFVLDTSGSMAGPKIEQARNALVYGVRTLQAGDRFNVLSFASAVRPFRDGLVEATSAVQEAAVSWIGGLQATGGTNFDAALRHAFRARRSDRSLDVVFITDGRPSLGITDAPSIVRLVKGESAPPARIYTFGVGHDLDVQLLDKIADATHGTRDYVAPNEDIEVVTGRFFRKVQSPVFTNVKLDLGRGVYDVYPQHVGDLFAGTQVVLFGRYRESGERTVTLTGTLAGEAAALERNATLVESGGPEYLQRLWANRKVAYLIDEIRLRGRTKEVVDEIVALGTRHSIVTPYTAGLVLEEDAVIGDERLADHVETDNDLPYEESFGQSEGLSDAPFEGPANSGTIGIGGGAGGAFKGRGGSRDLGTGGGGRKKFDDTVDDALRWLHAHQSPNGSWEAAGFDRWCDGRRRQGERAGLGMASYDVGVTGLALSAFLGAGYTNRGRHPFAKVVSRGLRYLKSVQRPDGYFGAPDRDDGLLQHTWATLAMVDAYAMTGSPIFLGAARRGLEVTYRMAHGLSPARNAGSLDDPELAVWMAQVIYGAALANRQQIQSGRKPTLPLPAGFAAQLAAEAAKRPARSAPDHARLLLSRMLLASTRPDSGAAAEALGAAPPRWAPADGVVDPMHWHHGSLALFQVLGRPYDAWKKGMEQAMVESQRKGGEYCALRGSWDPHGPWAARGGRVMATALIARALEVFYLYPRRFWESGPAFEYEELSDASDAAHSKRLKKMKDATALTDGGPTMLVRDVAGKRFGRRMDGRWIDLAWDGKGETTKVEALSDRYFALMQDGDSIARYLALGKHVVFVHGETVYEIVPPAK